VRKIPLSDSWSFVIEGDADMEEAEEDSDLDYDPENVETQQGFEPQGVDLS